jgi:mono/diheme cytochrome c family protein
MRKRLVPIGATLAGLVLIVGLVAVSWIRRGFSARDEPPAVERMLADRMRAWGVPARARQARNPTSPTPEVMSEARAHFADHCAGCHANDGSGRTDLGRHLYPRAPDMRLPKTQNLTDGELFSIIHNGIRLSGMSAWGSDDERGDVDSWKLVHFIRHLPSLTAEELAEMEVLNPKSPAELAEEQADRDFLDGSAPAPADAGHQHHH